jgi:HK97 family phage prohead protease
MSEPRNFGSIEEFRIAAKAEQDIGNAKVLASFDTEIKADGDARTLTFTISTQSVDRMGDTIKVDGWKLEQYRKNPVVLWAHDASILPVAKSNQVWVEESKLKSIAEFTPVGMLKFNDVVFDMYKGGFLSATSVGFAPVKYAFTDDPKRGYGIDFLEQELLEFSAVPVPANSEALIEGKSAGIDIGPMLDWCEKAICRAGDNARVVKLAESVLGNGSENIDWAKRIIAASSQFEVISTERLAEINALATEFRSDAKKAVHSKGASGIYRRCANRLEKAIGLEAAPAETPEQISDNAVPGFAEIASRRLKTIRYTGL